MPVKVPRGTRIAPLRYRLIPLAAVLGVLGTAAGTIMAALAALGAWLTRSGYEPEDVTGDCKPIAEPTRPDRVQEWLEHPAVEFGSEALSVLEVIRSRNSRSWIYRRFGLRRVDARTGGPMTVRGALITYAIPKSCLWLAGRLVDRQRRPPEELQRCRDQIRQEHRGDPEGEQRALQALNAEAASGCMTRIKWAFGIRLLLELPVLIGSLHQSLPDRLAGVIVVQDLRR